MMNQENEGKPTPLVDLQLRESGMTLWVDANFARTIERELAAANARISELEHILSEAGKEIECFRQQENDDRSRNGSFLAYEEGNVFPKYISDTLANGLR